MAKFLLYTANSESAATRGPNKRVARDVRDGPTGLEVARICGVGQRKWAARLM